MHCSPFLHDFSQEFQALKSRDDKVSKTLQSLKAAKNDRYRRFGAYVPAVLKSIEETFKRGGFHQKPRGPIGMIS